MASPLVLCTVSSITTKKDTKIFQSIQRKIRMVVKGLDGMICEEYLKSMVSPA